MAGKVLLRNLRHPFLLTLQHWNFVWISLLNWWSSIHMGFSSQWNFPFRWKLLFFKFYSLTWWFLCLLTWVRLSNQVELLCWVNSSAFPPLGLNLISSGTSSYSGPHRCGGFHYHFVCIPPQGILIIIVWIPVLVIIVQAPFNVPLVSSFWFTYQIPGFPNPPPLGLLACPVQ